MGGFIVGGVVVAALLVIGVLLSRVLQPPITPVTAATDDLVGALGTVVIRIPESGTGEVTITQPGQRLRLAAQSDATIAEGATVVVVDVTTPDAVVVAESGF